jgi:hypothetical protein
LKGFSKQPAIANSDAAGQKTLFKACKCKLLCPEDFQNNDRIGLKGFAKIFLKTAARRILI